MIKILIYIAAWQRREITKLCYDGVERLQAYNPDKYDIDCLVVYSDDLDGLLAKTYDFHTVHAPNLPLGRKFNIGLESAMGMEFDYLMQLGSDDLLSNNALDLYYPELEKGTELIGIKDLAFVDSTTKQAKYFEYTKIIGGGRCIKKSVIEDCATKIAYRAKCSFSSPVFGAHGKGAIVYLPVRLPATDRLFERIDEPEKFELWADDINSGLDYNSERTMKYKRRTEAVISHTEPLLVDIKSETNIHGYEKFKGKEYPFKALLGSFPQLRRL